MEECRWHSGITAKISELCRRLDRADGISDDQWSCIHSKISTKTLLTITSIVTIIILAVVGFLWNGQRVMSNDIAGTETKIIGIVEKVKTEEAKERKELAEKSGEDRKILGEKIEGMKGDIRELTILIKRERISIMRKDGGKID